MKIKGIFGGVKENHDKTGCHAYKIEMFYFQAHLYYLYIAKWNGFQNACFWMKEHRRKIVMRLFKIVLSSSVMPWLDLFSLIS